MDNAKVDSDVMESKKSQAMAERKVKKMSTKKVEDTAALRWARVVNRGAEARNAQEVRILQRAQTVRCHDLQREVQRLRKVLSKLNVTSGCLEKDVSQ